MDDNMTSKLEDFSETSKKLFKALDARSSLAWPIFKKQCEIAQLNPARLEVKHLTEIVPRIAEALSRFTSVQNGQEFAKQFLGRSVTLSLTSRGTIRPGLFTIGPETGNPAKNISKS